MESMIKYFNLYSFKKVWGQFYTGGVVFVYLILGIFGGGLSFKFYYEYKNKIYLKESLIKELTELQHQQNIVNSYKKVLSSSCEADIQKISKKISSPISISKIKKYLLSLHKKLDIHQAHVQFDDLQKHALGKGLKSMPISLHLKALHDKKIYKFIHQLLMQPYGIVVIHKMNMKRTAPLKEEGGKNMNKSKYYVESQIDLEWIFQEEASA